MVFPSIVSSDFPLAPLTLFFTISLCAHQQVYSRLENENSRGERCFPFACSPSLSLSLLLSLFLIVVYRIGESGQIERGTREADNLMTLGL